MELHMLKKIEELKEMETKIQEATKNSESISRNDGDDSSLTEEKVLTAYDVKLKDVYEYELAGKYSPVDCQIEENSFRFTTKESGTCGVITKNLFHTDTLMDKGELYVTFQCQFENSNADAYIKVCLFYQSYDKENEKYVDVVEPLSSCEKGEHVIPIDLVYYRENKGLGDTFQIIFVATKSYGVTRVSVSDLEIFQYGENVMEALKSLAVNVEYLKNKMSDNTQKSEYVTPNGTKCVLQVRKNGEDYEVYAVPVIPKNALFIGNSLLLGWKFLFGLCASSDKRDYYHYVTAQIAEKREGATFHREMGKEFEDITNAHTEIDTWIKEGIEDYMSEDTELVIIQLGDNVQRSNKDVLEENARKVLQTLRENHPKVRVAWVGLWYNRTSISAIQKACEQTGAVFVDITDLNVPDNRGKIGEIVTMPDGQTETVEKGGQASHPGDKGMLAIANRICYTLGITDSEDEITMETDEENVMGK